MKAKVYDMDDGTFSLYNEAGQVIEHDFDTSEEAIQWALENGYDDVDEAVKVCFRVFPEGDVIALFPDLPEHDGYITSYQHIGQHSAASPELINELPVATSEQYAELLKELESIGYVIGKVNP